MKKKLLLVLFNFLICWAICYTQDDTPQIRQFDIESIKDLGRMIYIKDWYAARATDVMYEAGFNLDSAKVKGWIVDMQLEVPLVLFISEEQEGIYRIALEIEFYSDTLVEYRVEGEKELLDRQLAMFRARQLAVRNIDNPCSERHNTVVIPNIVDGEGFLVYALAASIEDVIVYGGHYRFTISEDGNSILYKDRLSKGCLEGKKEPPEGVEHEFFIVTTALSDIPLETHVFLSLLHESLIMVMIMPSGERFGVVDGEIYPVGEDEK